MIDWIIVSSDCSSHPRLYAWTESEKRDGETTGCTGRCVVQEGARVDWIGGGSGNPWAGMLHNLLFSSTNLVIYPHLVLILSPCLLCRRSLRKLCQPQPMHQVRRTRILTHDLHKIYEVPVLTILDSKVLKELCCCGGDIKGEVETPSSAAPTTAAPTPDAFEETYAELRKWLMLPRPSSSYSL